MTKIPVVFYKMFDLGGEIADLTEEYTHSANKFNVRCFKKFTQLLCQKIILIS